MTADASFDEFYAAAYGRIVGQVYLLAGDLSEAQDVAQEAFLRALARWRTVQTLDDPTAWVRRVATNLAISRWRRNRNALTAWRRRAEPAAYAGPVAVDFDNSGSTCCTSTPAATSIAGSPAARSASPAGSTPPTGNPAARAARSRGAVR